MMEGNLLYSKPTDLNVTLIKKQNKTGTSLAVQWLRLHTSTAGGAGSIPGLGTKIP